MKESEIRVLFDGNLVTTTIKSKDEKSSFLFDLAQVIEEHVIKYERALICRDETNSAQEGTEGTEGTEGAEGIEDEDAESLSVIRITVKRKNTGQNTGQNTRKEIGENE